MASTELPERTHEESQAPSASPAQSEEPPPQPAVRFASVNQEIEPAQSLQAETRSDVAHSNAELGPDGQERLRSISKGLQESSDLQKSRLSNFAFEPVSLPVSRVPSNESTNSEALRESTKTGRASPRGSPSSIAAGVSTDRTSISNADLANILPESLRMTPQVSPSTKNDGPSAVSSNPPSRPSSASDQFSTRPTSHSQGSAAGETLHKVPRFSVAPVGDPPVPSRGPSPSRLPGGSGTVTPPSTFSRPFTPTGDRDDPYARSRRAPQNKNLNSIDQRFVFDALDSRRRSAYEPSTTLAAASVPRSSSGTDLKSQNRQSIASLHGLGGKKDDEGKQHGSMTDLKRFFHIGHHKTKKAQSSSESVKASANPSGSATPPYQSPVANVPFADDHGLQARYGNLGKVLGSGAGGSVRLIRRSNDKTIFAVKQFRDRHAHESERGYAKKVTAEFCIGSTLHHGNVIETLDIIHEGGHWFVIMEYAPYDLFAIVMSGKMSKEEIACTFFQIVRGVTYLHGMGLAHRDLKLDNVVVNEHGIMKIIDFGSATVFRYPFENDVVLASGIVGSDPYLAPEVYGIHKYDPQPTDIWSLAIIYACMILRRFPWRSPRPSDGAYRLFISPPNITPTEDFASRPAEERRKSETSSEDTRRASASDVDRPRDRESSTRSHRHHHHHHHHHERQGDSADTTAAAGIRPEQPKEEIKGSWRLLRLLPRNARDLIGSMLEIDPQHRAKLDDILQDPWLIQTPVCSELEGRKFIKAEGHHHTLEHSLNKSGASSKA